MTKRLRLTLVFDNLALPKGITEERAGDVAAEIATELGHTPITVKAILATPNATRDRDYWRVLVRVQPPQ